MEYTYELVENFGNTVIKRTDTEGNEAWIPTDPANSDYAEYLASLEPNLPEVKETPEALEAENN
jgi:hypothetical protein